MTLPPNLTIIEGDLLKILDTNPEIKIAHQTNCVTWTSAGLGKLIFDKVENSNIYSRRFNKKQFIIDQPGTITLSGNDRIINMFGQFLPSKPCKYNISKYYGQIEYAKHIKFIDNTDEETYQQRLQWFKNCLDQIGMILSSSSHNTTEVPTHTIAFPYEIGCGLAGGIWKDYYNMLYNFSLTYPNLNILIVRLKK
jgi:AAA+ ATPase superfamily predicted ATPase